MLCPCPHAEENIQVHQTLTHHTMDLLIAMAMLQSTPVPTPK